METANHDEIRRDTLTTTRMCLQLYIYHKTYEGHSKTIDNLTNPAMLAADPTGCPGPEDVAASCTNQRHLKVYEAHVE